MPAGSGVDGWPGGAHEADAQGEHAGRQDHRARGGEPDQGVRLGAARRGHRSEEGGREQDGADREGVARERAGPVAEVGLVDVAEREQGEHQQHAGVRVPGAPQVLPQRVLLVGGVVHQLVEEGDAAVDHGGEDDQQDAGEPARQRAHLMPRT